MLNSQTRAVLRVRDEARTDTWSSSHIDCFRCTIGKGESDAHIMAKFKLWLEFKRMGCKVLTELIWKQGGRSDLVVCWNNGDIQIVEVAKSEKEESLLLKETKYPFPIKVFRI